MTGEDAAAQHEARQILARLANYLDVSFTFEEAPTLAGKLSQISNLLARLPPVPPTVTLSDNQRTAIAQVLECAAKERDASGRWGYFAPEGWAGQQLASLLSGTPRMSENRLGSAFVCKCGAAILYGRIHLNCPAENGRARDWKGA